MNEWPSGWFRNDRPRPPAGGADGYAEPPARMAAGSGAAAGGWPAQPPVQGRGAPPGAPLLRRAGARPGYAPGTSGPGGGLPRRPGRGWGPRRFFGIAAVVVAAVLIVVVGTYFYVDGKLARKNVLVSYSGRPAAGAGQNWLITGSDSRQGLTRSQMRRLHTGYNVSGQRSDTVMLLHVPSNGTPAVLVSLPRDWYVTIPGNGPNKLNAAYSFGGPKLLVQTVEKNTGLRIDHYMGIGFGGLVHVVDAVGGVRLCIHTAIHDQASGLHLKAGCNNLSGGQALAFVRARHPFAQQDLQRVQDQRLFLAALLRKVTSPSTILNPFASVPAAFGAADTLTVDKGTHLYQLLQIALALRHPETTTLPISNSNYYTPAGDALLWNQAEATQLFNDLRTDQPVPKSLLSGSKLG